MIDCRQIREALEMAHLEGPQPDLAAEIRDHLEACPECQREARELEQAWLLLPASLEPVSVRPEFEAAVLERIAAAQTGATTSLPQAAFWKYALAASVFVALTLALLWSRQTPDGAELELADSEQIRLETLAEQMQNLQELEKTFGRAQLQFASLQSVGEDSEVSGTMVYDYKAGEGHFFGFHFEEAVDAIYKLWLLDAEQQSLSSSVIQIDEQTGRGSAIIQFPSDTTAMKEVIVTLEKDRDAATPSAKLQLRSSVEPKAL